MQFGGLGSHCGGCLTVLAVVLLGINVTAGTAVKQQSSNPGLFGCLGSPCG